MQIASSGKYTLLAMKAIGWIVLTSYPITD
jgi:hypothetical protein